MQTQTIQEILKANYNIGFNKTDQFNRISFRAWMYKGVEDGTIVLPEGIDEYDVYEAADNY